MERLERGQLRLVTPDGKLYTFGTPGIYNAANPNPNRTATASAGKDEIRVQMTVVNDAFWVRMLLLADLGFAEAYMAGDIEVDNLEDVFKVRARSSRRAGGGGAKWGRGSARRTNMRFLVVLS